MIFTHDACLRHDPGPGHPESPQRLVAVLQALADSQFDGVPVVQAPQATRAELERAHDAALVAAIFANAPDEGLVRIDADTTMSPGSLEAALRAAGAVRAAVDAVITGPSRRAFCAVRPPGHHATHGTPMGFCLFNNVAVGALHAIAAHGLERVAIVDFDVHHGNGTQDIFWRDSRVLYESTHQFPLYPGTGRPEERGVGNIVNAILPPGSGGATFRAACERTILPALDAFAPQLVIASAGFDAHRLDPLAGLDLVADDYAWITRELVAIADKHANGRMVSALEGGYSLEALRESVTAHCRELFGLS